MLLCEKIPGSPRFPYCKQQKAGRGLGTRLLNKKTQMFTSRHEADGYFQRWMLLNKKTVASTCEADGCFQTRKYRQLFPNKIVASSCEADGYFQRYGSFAQIKRFWDDVFSR